MASQNDGHIFLHWSWNGFLISCATPNWRLFLLHGNDTGVMKQTQIWYVMGMTNKKSCWKYDITNLLRKFHKHLIRLRQILFELQAIKDFRDQKSCAFLKNTSISSWFQNLNLKSPFETSLMKKLFSVQINLNLLLNRLGL